MNKTPENKSELLKMIDLVDELHGRGDLVGIEGIAVSFDINEQLRRELREMTSHYPAYSKVSPPKSFFGIPIHVCPGLKGNQWMLMRKPDLRNRNLSLT